MNNFVVLMQTTTTNGSQWDDVRPAEVVEGARLGDTAQGVALDWVERNVDPDLEDNWRVLTWRLDRYQSDQPEAIVPAKELRTPTVVRSTPRGSRKRFGSRVHGPVSEVVIKQRIAGPTEDLIGRHILVTTDRRNSAAPDCPGPWFPARQPEGAVRVVVRGGGMVYASSGTMWRAIDTSVGQITMLPMDLAYIPAEEDA